jgi:UDP-glucose 4-epimerase
VELLSLGVDVVVYDDLSNSKRTSLRVASSLAAAACSSPGELHFRDGDVRDGARLRAVLAEFPAVSSCVHFAGLKAVGESQALPLSYYDVNVAGTLALLGALKQANVKNFVFSSSATVYGDPDALPISESAPLRATNPYGRTKLFVEEILRDAHAADPGFWNVLVLRYFNPIGAHPSGELGEDPAGVPNNLMPFVAQVCVGRRGKLAVFGDDYATPDGTGVRDYSHVVDLARGHAKALEKLASDRVGCEAVNLGTGKGYSVLDLVRGMEAATGRPVPYEIAGRRPGDIAECYASAGKAEEMLGWRAEKGLREMCEDTWRWQESHPNGFEEEEIEIS